jgi:hypothetical protein
MRCSLLVAALAVGLFAEVAPAALVITEVASTSGAPAGALAGLDWWELTNTGPGGVSLDGYEWKDSDGGLPGTPDADTAIFPSGTTIGAGESLIVHDGDSAVPAAFRTDWGLNSSVQILYGDQFSGNNSFSGLSSGGDKVELYDSTAALVAEVMFGSATAGVSFEWNTLGASLGLSVAGENGAIGASNNRIGSPGAVPEPGALALVGIAIGGLVGCTRRRRS